MSAQEIAQLLQGKIEGNPQAQVSGFGKIEEARPNELTFLANLKYEHYLYESQASVVVINDDLVLKQPITPTIIRVKDSYSAIATLLAFQEQQTKKALVGIEQPSFVANSASIGKEAYIGAFAYIGENAKIAPNVKIYPQVFIGANVQIGEGAIIYPGVKIYHGCIIGKNVIIHAGTVIGSDGFGFAPQPDGSFIKIPQTGNVTIDDNVEIGANSTIDRATMGSTHIKKGVKIDNLVQIAHNVEIGESTVIAAQAGISGSAKLGQGIMVGGQAGIVGHITLANGTKINAQSGVTKSTVQTGTVLTGSPAGPYTQTLRNQAIFRNLPNILKRIEQIEETLNKSKN